VCGSWHATIDDPEHIDGLHTGTFAYHHLIDPSSPYQWVDTYCQANDHRFTLTPRTGQ